MKVTLAFLVGLSMVAGFTSLPTQSAHSATASDWRQFRGPAGLGVSADHGVPLTWGPTQNIAWKVTLPGQGASSPIVVGSRVIVTCHSGPLDQVKRQVLCFNRADGTLLWNTDVPSKLPEGRIYLGRSGRTFVLAAKPAFESLATNDLETRGLFNSSPAVAGGRFYIRSDKFLHCIGAQ